jgi:hypothetical protein
MPDVAELKRKLAAAIRSGDRVAARAVKAKLDRLADRLEHATRRDA